MSKQIIKFFLFYLAISNVSPRDVKRKENIIKVPNITLSYNKYLIWLNQSNFPHLVVNPNLNRLQIYLENLKKINEHNQRFNEGKEHNFLGLNQLTDWTDDELKIFFTPSKPIPLPVLVDYRQQGILGTVKNQMNLANSGIFAALSVIESQFFKMTGELVSLSEQYVNDCSTVATDSDIIRSVEHTFEFIKDLEGLPSSDVYPLQSRKKRCETIKKTEKFRIIEIKRLDSKDETSILDAISNVGPIVVFLSVNREFKSFTGGLITDDKFCSGVSNHAVTLVAYSKQSFLFRNSWGEDWGESGYFRIARKNCSFSVTPMYAIIETTNENYQ